MHVLHVESGRHLYGGARQVLLLLEGLRAAGVRGSLAVARSSALGVQARTLGFDVYPAAPGGDLDIAAVFRLRRLIGVLQPDLVHLHSRRGADWIGALAARLAAVPALLTRRVDHPPPAAWVALIRRSCGAVVAISEAVAAELRAAGLPPDACIPSAVDAARPARRRARESLLEELGLPADTLLTGIVAQLIPRKGHEVLFEAWPRIRAQCPGAFLLVLGSGPLEPRLRRRAAELSGVRFAGFRSDLGDWIGHLDLLIHPARAEGLGLSLLEAQAAGVPVVASAAGGIPEAIVDGRTGMLVPPGDAGALAEAVIALLRAPERRREFGAAGHRHVAARFGVSRMAEAYIAEYRRLLSQ